MKNTEMLDYLRKAEKAAYDDMMKPRIGEFAYEYHRGRYDEIVIIRKALEKQLTLDAQVMNSMVGATVLDLQAQLKWTALPWRRKRFHRAIRQLNSFREPIEG